MFQGFNAWCISSLCSRLGFEWINGRRTVGRLWLVSGLNSHGIRRWVLYRFCTFYLAVEVTVHTTSRVSLSGWTRLLSYLRARERISQQQQKSQLELLLLLFIRQTRVDTGSTTSSRAELLVAGSAPRTTMLDSSLLPHSVFLCSSSSSSLLLCLLLAWWCKKPN